MKKAIILIFILSFSVVQNYCGTDSTEFPTTLSIEKVTELPIITLSPVCKEVKKLDPWGKQEEFTNLAQTMNTENKTLCDCIKEITHAKKNKTLSPFAGIRATNDYYTNFTFKDIRCEPDVPKELCLTVNEVFNESKEGFTDVEYDNFLKVKLSNFTGIKYNASHFSLNIDPKHLSSKALREILNHEKIHGDLPHTQLHQGFSELIKNKIAHQPDFAQLKEDPDLINKISLFKLTPFFKSQELEADLLPAACAQNFCTNNALSSLINDSLQALYQELTENRIPDQHGKLIAQCLSSDTNYNNSRFSIICSALFKGYKKNFDEYDSTHPNTFERIAWLYKVGRLRKAQKELKSQDKSIDNEE